MPKFKVELELEQNEIGHLINKDTHFQRILSFVFPDEAKMVFRAVS